MRTGLIAVGNVMEKIPSVISRRKYEYLKAFERTLTQEESALIKNYENQKQQAELKKYEVQKPLLEKKALPKKESINALPVHWMKKQFKIHWEKNQNRELIVTDNNRNVLNALCYYFANQPGPLDLNKGILISGQTGTGKTSFMKAFHSIWTTIYKEQGIATKPFSWSNCIELVDEFEDNSMSKTDFYRNYTALARHFDDFGQERDASKYGIVNIMKDLMEKRYLGNWKTFITTNLNEEGIYERYGFRVHSRVHEHFNFIILNGEDFRVLNNNS